MPGGALCSAIDSELWCVVLGETFAFSEILRKDSIKHHILVDWMHYNTIGTNLIIIQLSTNLIWKIMLQLILCQPDEVAPGIIFIWQVRRQIQGSGLGKVMHASSD